MFSAMIYIAGAVSLWSDWRIYKSFIANRGKLLALLWKIQAVLSVFPLLVLFVGGFFVDIRWTPWSLFSLWYMAFFFLQFFLKFFVAVAFQYGIKHGKKWHMPLAITISLLAVGLYLYGMCVSRCRIDVQHVDIVSDNLPESFNGFTVAQISDLHLGTMSLDRNLLERVVDSVNSLNPDIVVQSGDIINLDVREFTPDIRTVLKRIHAPVYAVFGNHDLGLYFKDTIKMDPAKMVDSLRKLESSVMGWTLLENSHLFFDRGDDSIAIAGITYPNNIRKYNNTVCGVSDIRRAMEGVPESVFSLLIAHTPDMVDSLPAVQNRVDLMLSGHTHAMQLKICGVCPSMFIYRYPSGLYDIDRTKLYVNGGIGSVGHPFRLGASPEITLLTLKKR